MHFKDKKETPRKIITVDFKKRRVGNTPREPLLDGIPSYIEDINSLKEKQNQRLIEGVKDRCIQEVVSALKAGADINAQDIEDHDLMRYNDWTALMYACSSGHESIGDYLLKMGADTEIRDKLGATALFRASMFGQNDMVNLLIAYNANINAKASNGRDALMVAAFEGHCKVAITLILNGIDIYAKDNEGYNAENIAFREGHKKFVKEIRKAKNYNL